MLKAPVDHGFTLIELIITLAVLSGLLALAVPNFAQAINNAKVRTIAETLLNGARAAQAAAIQQSHQSAFILTNATPAKDALPVANGQNWYAQMLPVYAGEASDASFYLQGGSFGNQTSGVTITGPSAICFNSIGRIASNASTGIVGVTCNATAVNYDIAYASAERAMQVQISVSGKIRLCDKARSLSAATPDGC